MGDLTTKCCTKCRADKPLSEFKPDPRYKGGYTTWCKPCIAVYQAEHHLKNAEERRARNNARCREQWSNSPEYRKRKNEQKKINNQTASNQARLQAWGRARYLREKDSTPEWRLKKRWNWKTHQHRRRAWVRGAGKYTQAEWQAICKAQQGRCAACGIECVLTIDHVVPLSKGGKNTADNLQGLCIDCNRHKSAKTIDYRVLSQGLLDLD